MKALNCAAESTMAATAAVNGVVCASGSTKPSFPCLLGIGTSVTWNKEN
jgi:hypothetical protein